MPSDEEYPVLLRQEVLSLRVSEVHNRGVFFASKATLSMTAGTCEFEILRINSSIRHKKGTPDRSNASDALFITLRQQSTIDAAKPDT